MTKQNSDAYPGAASAEPELPPELIARVLGKLGVQIDPSTEEGRLRAVEFVSAALSDPAMTERIIAALDDGLDMPPADAHPASDCRSTTRFFPIVRSGKRTPADEFLMDDEPTRGRLLRSIAQAKKDSTSRPGVAKRLLGR
jgi:hypothetical protein